MSDNTNPATNEADLDWGAALAEQAASGNKTAAADEDLDWGAALAEQSSKTHGKRAEPAANGDQAKARPVAMPSFDAPNGAEGKGDNLDVILDIPVTIAMEIGRARIPIRNLMQLNQGSVIELERLAGEPLDVMVNGMLIAHGEVVVVNEHFGIRFTDVISPAERVQKLR